MKKNVIPLPDEISTLSLGMALAAACQKSCILYLYGDLGTGKTTLCRGFLNKLGHIGNVKSPTYTLVESYRLQYWTVYHFDFYRLRDPEELEFIGVRDYFDDTSLFLVEWPQRGQGILPIPDITVTLAHRKKGLQAQTRAMSVKGQRTLGKLKLRQGMPS